MKKEQNFVYNYKIFQHLYKTHKENVFTIELVLKCIIKFTLLAMIFFMENLIDAHKQLTIC